MLFPKLFGAGLAYLSLAGIAVANASFLEAFQSAPDGGGGISVSVVPTISLVAVVGAAVTVGMMFQRMKDVERRVRELERESDGRRHRRDTV